LPKNKSGFFINTILQTESKDDQESSSLISLEGFQDKGSFLKENFGGYSLISVFGQGYDDKFKGLIVLQNRLVLDHSLK